MDRHIILYKLILVIPRNTHNTLDIDCNRTQVVFIKKLFTNTFRIGFPIPARRLKIESCEKHEELLDLLAEMRKRWEIWSECNFRHRSLLNCCIKYRFFTVATTDSTEAGFGFFYTFFFIFHSISNELNFIVLSNSMSRVPCSRHAKKS